MKESAMGFFFGITSYILFDILWNIFYPKTGLELNKSLVGFFLFLTLLTGSFLIQKIRQNRINKKQNN